MELNGLAVDEDGTQKWYQNGLLHRTDGPALIYEDVQFWYQNGWRHRVDGPAEIWTVGEHYWYLEGQQYSFDMWLEKTASTDKDRTFLALKWG